MRIILVFLMFITVYAACGTNPYDITTVTTDYVVNNEDIASITSSTVFDTNWTVLLSGAIVATTPVQASVIPWTPAFSILDTTCVSIGGSGIFTFTIVGSIDTPATGVEILSGTLSLYTNIVAQIEQYATGIAMTGASARLSVLSSSTFTATSASSYAISMTSGAQISTITGSFFDSNAQIFMSSATIGVVSNTRFTTDITSLTLVNAHVGTMLDIRITMCIGTAISMDSSSQIEYARLHLIDGGCAPGTKNAIVVAGSRTSGISRFYITTQSQTLITTLICDSVVVPFQCANGQECLCVVFPTHCTCSYETETRSESMSQTLTLSKRIVPDPVVPPGPEPTATDTSNTYDSQKMMIVVIIVCLLVLVVIVGIGCVFFKKRA